MDQPLPTQINPPQTPSPLVPIPPQTPPVETPPVEPLPPKPPKKWAPVIIGGLVLLLALAGGVFFLISRQSSEPAEGERGFGIIDLPNRYTSTNCGYSVVAPEGWQIVADAEKEIGGVLLLSSIPVTSEIAQPGELRAIFTCSDYDSSLEIQEVVGILNQRYAADVKIGAMEQATVSAKPAYRQTVDVIDKNRILEYYLFSSPGRVVIINFVPADTILQAQIEEILNSLVI